MRTNLSADHDPETLQLARLAYVFCRSATRPIEGGALPHLKLADVVHVMWEDSQNDLLRLWGRVGEVLPNERNCVLNQTIIEALPRESLSIAEIFVGALRRNVTDHFLRKVVPPMVPAKMSGQFLAHGAPNLANVFDK